MSRKGINNIYFLPDGETMSDWCRRNNIPSNSVYRQLDKGMLVKDACEAGKRAYERYKSFKPIMYKGKSLYSQFSTCAYVSILAHIRNGLSVEEAVATYEKNKRVKVRYDVSKPIIDLKNGRIYPSGRACAKALGIGTTTVRDRAKNNRGLAYYNKEKENVKETI